jgi:uncharacterized protein DUF4446
MRRQPLNEYPQEDCPTLGEMTAEVSATLSVIALIVALVTLAWVFFLAFRLRRRGRRGAGVDASNPDLESAVESAFRRLDELSRRLDGVAGRLPVVEDQGKRAVQHVGVVRFNPFEDTGGNQSFALALLDSQGDGVVMSSLHSRQSTRIYLKPIVNGRSETALSDEETEALRKAGVA